MTLKIEGATVRPELNGIYMPERETYFQRPVFYCAENDRVLFYHGHPKFPASHFVSFDSDLWAKMIGSHKNGWIHTFKKPR